jgi:hypothetical protein
MRHLIYFLVVANLAFFFWHAIEGRTVGETEAVLPPLPDGMHSLVTLEEREAAQAAAIESITGSEPPGAGISISCYMLGPFYSAAEMQAVEERLNQSGFKPVQSASEENVETGYWIYLPAMGRDAAEEIAILFDSKNDRDYFIGKDNVVALGAFKELTRAETRLEHVRRYGLDPVLEPRYRTETVHWLEFEGSGDEGVDLTAVTEGFPDVRTQQRVCE